MRYPKTQLSKTKGARSKTLLLVTFASLALAGIVTAGLIRPVESKSGSKPSAGLDGFARRAREIARRRVNAPAENQLSIAKEGFAPSSPMFISITVDRTDDDASVAASLCTVAPNDCSLRGAIAFANAVSGTTINIPAGTYQLTIDGASETGFCTDASIGDLDIAGDNTTIVGAGAATTIIQQTRPNDRVFCVDQNLVGNFTFSISGVTITGGHDTFGVGGGGIVSGGTGDVTNIQDCIISGNTVSGAGSPVGGGVGNGAGSLSISGTTFNGNTSVGSGGGVYFSGLTGGTLQLSNSTFTNNTSSGGNAGGLLATQGSTYTVTGSSFTGNQSLGSNGQGGAIFNESGMMSVTTSSISGNSVASGTGKGGGIANSNTGNLTANFNRIAGNTANAGSGVSNGGTANVNDNWWGCNDGPGSGSGCSSAANNLFGASAASWLQLRHVASPNSICASSSSTLTADIKGRNVGSALTTELNGLPAFPVPPATIFSNAVNGSLSGASTQFVNGVATATFTASGGSSGSADATADSQTVTASVTISTNTTSALTNQAVCAGGTATFSTTASGPGPITFVWKKGTTVLNNGDLGGRVTIVSGATSSTLSISNVQASDADTYTVEATGSCNTATQSATLTVNTPTTTTDPPDQTVCQGAMATFSTTAGGTGPFSYAWTLDGNPTGGNSSSVTIDTSSLSGNHTVSVTTTGACGSASQSATLTVNTPTTTTDPPDQTVCQGAMATFSTTAGGTGPFSYAWTLDGNPTGGNSSSVTIDTSSLSGNHTVSVTTTGACGSASQSATLTVNTPTTTTDPPDQTVCQGAMATFSTTAGGTGPFSYAWTLDGNPTGGNSSSVTIDTSSLSGNHTVSVMTTGACGSASQSATLTVNTPTTTSDPPDQTVCQGAMATFSTTAGGTGPFSYAWALDGNPTGGNSSSVTIDTSSLSGNHTVSVTTTGACGSASQSATLTVNTPTTTTDPPDQTVCQGAMATFSTTAGGTGPFSYAWTLDGNPTGGNSSSVTIDTSSLSGNHTVSVTTTGACGSASQSATLTVNTPTTTTDPADQSVCEGGTANFSTTAGGTGPFSYAWTVDGNPAGGNSPNLSVNTTGFSQGNHTVTVTTTGSCGSASQSATLTVNNNPPVINVANSSISMWPPNHQYENFTLADFGVTASSSCDGDLTSSVVIVSVTSDELDDNPAGADGSTTNDMVIAADCKSVQLRRERDGDLDGRVYTVTFSVTDSVGHTTTATAHVTVPLNQNGGGAVDSGVHNTVNGTCP